MQGLDAASGAEIERRVDDVGQLQSRERGRRTADPEHVVGAQRPAGRELAAVARDPPRAGAVRVEERVRAKVHRRPARGVEEAEPASAVEAEGGQRGGQLRAGHRHPEQERGRESRRRPACLGGERPERGHAVAALERRLGLGAPQRLELVDGVPRGPQIASQALDEVRIGGGEHASHPTLSAREHPTRRTRVSSA
ncbi:hypothetical protein GCM10025881_32140 [Pseudolysinimonas kribbensis]|uniref:Uncharacterized protein n=1 Tax=Pseudolysinimonas kribbensis TaxID=433641 RepID=A0ABQ6K6W7_9MICO|nr:hypothetical protein GCM10025881_32140 [Pseudolysinimonas kribbensis]